MRKEDAPKSRNRRDTDNQNKKSRPGKTAREPTRYTESGIE